MLLDVLNVKVLADYSLWLEFENGEQRVFSMATYISQKPWLKLKQNGLFSAASVENGTVAWPGNIDIDPETLYECSIPYPDDEASAPFASGQRRPIDMAKATFKVPDSFFEPLPADLLDEFEGR